MLRVAQNAVRERVLPAVKLQVPSMAMCSAPTCRRGRCWRSGMLRQILEHIVRVRVVLMPSSEDGQDILGVRLIRRERVDDVGEFDRAEQGRPDGPRPFPPMVVNQRRRWRTQGLRASRNARLRLRPEHAVRVGRVRRRHQRREGDVSQSRRRRARATWKFGLWGRSAGSRQRDLACT